MQNNGQMYSGSNPNPYAVREDPLMMPFGGFPFDGFHHFHHFHHHMHHHFFRRDGSPFGL